MDYKEKAKAYDEALEKAKEILEMTSDKSAIYTIFPGLAESEDERIRKQLEALVRWAASCSASGVSDAREKKMLEWLKKQRPVWSREDQRNLFELKQRMSQIDHYWNRPTDEKLIDGLDSIEERMRKGE